MLNSNTRAASQAFLILSCFGIPVHAHGQNQKAPAVPGTVIAHSPAKSRMYIGSPSLAILPSGTYVASHDFFGPGSTRDTSQIFASEDRGRGWKKLAVIKGQWWSTLFVHRGDLFIMGTSKEYGFTVIRRSTDGGRTWTEPRDDKTGLLLDDGMFHCAPVPVVEHKGRIWRAMESYTGPKWGSFKSFMMSAPADADLLHASSWLCTNRLDRDQTWLNNRFGGWLEGNAVVTREGEVVNILRADFRALPEKAAIVRISNDGKEATFNPMRDFIDFPGGCKKFTIRYDPVRKAYWTLSNHVPLLEAGASVERSRNTLALCKSTDMRNWQVMKIILRHPDPKQHGFQYVDWLFDGDDLAAVVRTAYDEADGTQAHNSHDANYLIFLRISDFRSEKTAP